MIKLLKSQRWIILLAVVAQLIFGVAPVMAAAPTTAIGKIDAMEVLLYGTVQSGSLVERADKLELDINEHTSTDPILVKIDRLYAYLLAGAETSPSFVTRLNAVEWTFTQQLTDTPAKTRLENVEKLLNGAPGAGGLDSRLNKLMAMAFRDGTIHTAKAAVAKDTLIKIKLMQALDSKTTRPGDKVTVQTVDNLYVGNTLVIPKGALGYGTVQEVEQSKNFGRDAKIKVEFERILGMDGTVVNTYLGDLAKEATKSEAKAAGATVAGMIVFGPVGVVTGAFVHGKELTVPAGSTLFVQAKEDVELYGLINQ